MHIPGIGFLLRRGGAPKRQAEMQLTPRERDAKVDSELEQAKQCIIRKDDRCTVAHLLEANKYEDCPVCERRIDTFRKQISGLPRDKQLQKLQLIQKFVNPSADVHRMIVEADAIKPRGGIFRVTRTLKRTILRRK